MSNTTYGIPVVASGVNAPSVSLVNDDAESRTFIFASTLTSDRVAIFGSNDGVNFPPITATPLASMGGNSPPITLNDRSLQYRAVFTGSGVRTLSVRAGTCCAGGGTVPSEHFVTLPLGNYPAGGVIGTAAATVDQFAAFTIAQTTAGQTLTFPAPTDPTATYVRWISNIGTQSFVLYGLIVLPGSGTKLIWNGSAWFNGCVGTSTPTLSVLAAGGKDVLNSDGTVTELGNSEAIVPASQLTLLAGSGEMTLEVDSTGNIVIHQIGVGQIVIDTVSGAIGIGDANGTAKTVTVGSITGAARTVLQCGTGGIGVGDNATDHSTSVGSVTGVSLTSIQFGTGGCHIQGVAGGTIGIGNNVVDHDTIVGSVTGVSLLTLQGGTSGVTIQPAATGPLTAKSGTSGAATFDSGSTGAVHLGDGAAVKAVTLGSITGASSLTIRAGTGGLQIVNNGVTWTWPTALGAAGTKLTDAAGNGVLSFA